MLSKLLNNGVFLVCWRQLVGNLASDPFCTLSVLPSLYTDTDTIMWIVLGPATAYLRLFEHLVH